MQEVVMMSIVFSFAAFVCTGIYRLIRLKIERNNGTDEEMFERLAKAFLQHKKNTERRLQNLEAIISDDDRDRTSSAQKSMDAPNKTIEIMDDDGGDKSTENRGNLRNMLRE